YKESVALRQHYREFKEAFKTRNRDNYNKVAEQTTTFSEAELITRDELALDGLSFRDNNKENNPTQGNISLVILMEEDFTTVSYKRKKNKQIKNIRKQATVRQTPYKKG
ncbi:11280_t:CDS:2, partial [Ambispora leptoticha]